MKMNLPLRILLLPALLTSCDTLTDWFPPSPQKDVTRVDERHTARLIALNKCPVADRDESPLPQFVPPVLALAIPIIIDIGVKAFAQAAEHARHNLSATYIA